MHLPVICFWRLSCAHGTNLLRPWGSLVQTGMVVTSYSNAQDVAADELVFSEPPLVAGQHATNRQDALVCSHCFSMLGSIEQQIAHRLLARASAGGSCSVASQLPVDRHVICQNASGMWWTSLLTVQARML